MASRKDQKEQARARRLAEERAHAARARRQRRLQMVGGVVLLAVAVVVVAVVLSSGSATSSTTGLLKGKAKVQTTSTVNGLLAGIPQSGPRLGNPEAPVTMTYYGDLQCPVCQEFTLQGGFSQLVSNEVKAGKVKIVYSGFETATRDPATFRLQQLAALAAGRQSKFWDYTELFYHQQGAEGTGYVTESYLEGLAKQIAGLNLVRWESDRNDATLSTDVTTQEQSATNLGVTGTPTLVFQGPKGKASPSATVPTYAQLQQAVKQVA